MSRYFALLALVFTFLLSTQLQAQVRESAGQPFSAYGYATASGSQREFNYGHALGGSLGLILQRSPSIALDFRGVGLRERVPLHTYLAEVGPRVSRRYGPARPYAEVLGGLGHSGYRGYTIPRPPLRVAWGLAWSAALGVDLRITHDFQWRVAEYSYNEVYVGPGAKSSIFSTGVIYRFF